MKYFIDSTGATFAFEDSDSDEFIAKYSKPDWQAIAELPPVVVPPVNPVPASVSPRQIRQALTRFNVRDQVEAAVANGDQDLKDWWEFATVFERNHPMVVNMAVALGISEQDLDAIFMAAGAL